MSSVFGLQSEKISNIFTNILLKDESKIVSEPIIEKEEDDDSISEEKMFESMLQNQTPTFYDFRQDYIQPQPVEEEPIQYQPPIQYQQPVQPKYEEVEEGEEVMMFEESSDDDESVSRPVNNARTNKSSPAQETLSTHSMSRRSKLVNG